MLLPKRDCDVDYDDPDFVMPWWQIVGTFVYGGLAALIVAATLAPVALFSRPKREDALYLDPIAASLAREARER